MPMDLSQLQKDYEAAWADRFPSVRGEAKQEGLMTVVDAYRVPDGRAGDFMTFLLDELPARLERAGVPLVPVTPHSESATRRFFPELYAAFTSRPTPRVRKVQPPSTADARSLTPSKARTPQG